MSAGNTRRGEFGSSRDRLVISRRDPRATGRAVVMTERLEQRMMLSVTPSLVANRVSGVAPLAVHFDATGTTSTATTRPFDEIQYEWSFGDAASGSWNVSGRSRNAASGAVAGHVFEHPGTYTVALNVRDPDGSVGTQTVTINVQDPDTVFSGTNTIVFSAVGDFTGAPAGALQVTTGSLATMITYAAPGKRLLLHRGETWTNASEVTVRKLGPGIVGAFGSGAKPKIVSSSNVFAISDRFRGMEDWRFMDLELVASVTTGVGAFGFKGAADDILIERVDISGFGGGIGSGPDILNYWNTTAYNGHTLYDGISLVDNTVDNGQGGGGHCGMFLSGQRMLVMGNSITNMQGVEHTMRTPWLEKTVLSDNYLGIPASAKHNLKLHAPQFEVAGLGYHHYSEQIVVSNNVFDGGSNPWIVTVGPQDHLKDERVRDLVFENNLVRSTSSTQVAVIFWASQVTARNNIISMFSSDTGILIGRRGMEPTPNDDRLYNNTVYAPSGTATAINVAGATNTVAKDNLYAGAGTLVKDTGTGTVQANNLMTASPGFVSATPVNAADFALTSSSPAVDAGTATPLWKDFGGNSRPGGNAYDIGAWESAGTPVASEVILDNTSAGVAITGSWTSSTFSPGYYGSNYIHDGNTGKGTKSVRYTPTLTTSSYYEVFTNFTAGSNRDAAVPFDINYAGGARTVFVNQQINNGVWVSLGTYAFSAGTSGNVLIRNAGTTGYVVADAIKFVPVTVAPIIQDNTDASGITITGSWTSSTFWPGYYGADYIHDGDTGKAAKSVRYTPTLLASGNYEVFTLATAATNRATNIPFDINYAGGTSMVFVNQQINNGVWVSLGTYAFTAGTSGSVLIRTDGTTGYVAADAIKFVPVA